MGFRYGDCNNIISCCTSGQLVLHSLGAADFAPLNVFKRAPNIENRPGSSCFIAPNWHRIDSRQTWLPFVWEAETHELLRAERDGGIQTHVLERDGGLFLVNQRLE
ncbi:unnamed protein product [Danaus chrysippus]|uniref:(African queen) hypothetical protein n=1 Tax=Danaus chrysippus TaxID=151541 RepID=A0A8J2R7D0_9NEOP|nr:unnamed protein product [Danaus chrysippus]